MRWFFIGGRGRWEGGRFWHAYYYRNDARTISCIEQCNNLGGWEEEVGPVEGSCEWDNRGRRPSRIWVNRLRILPELYRVLKDLKNCYSFSLIYRVLKCVDHHFIF